MQIGDHIGKRRLPGCSPSTENLKGISGLAIAQRITAQASVTGNSRTGGLSARGGERHIGATLSPLRSPSV
jgi:hypothetical protein